MQDLVLFVASLKPEGTSWRIKQTERSVEERVPSCYIPVCLNVSLPSLAYMNRPLPPALENVFLMRFHGIRSPKVCRVGGFPWRYSNDKE